MAAISTNDGSTSFNESNDLDMDEGDGGFADFLGQIGDRIGGEKNRVRGAGHQQGNGDGPT